MDVPKPTADHARLEKLAGVWRGTETMHPSDWDPQGGQAEGVTRARVALGGFPVIVDYEQIRGGERTFEGHGVFTWDPQAREVILHWFDSIGQGREEFRGGWTGDVLAVTSKNQMGFARLTYDRSTPGTLLSGMEMSRDGKNWSSLFDGQYTEES